MDSKLHEPAKNDRGRARGVCPVPVQNKRWETSSADGLSSPGRAGPGRQAFPTGRARPGRQPLPSAISAGKGAPRPALSVADSGVSLLSRLQPVELRVDRLAPGWGALLRGGGLARTLAAWSGLAASALGLAALSRAGCLSPGAGCPGPRLAAQPRAGCLASGVGRSWLRAGWLPLGWPSWPRLSCRALGRPSGFGSGAGRGLSGCRDTLLEYFVCGVGGGHECWRGCGVHQRVRGRAPGG